MNALVSFINFSYNCILDTWPSLSKISLTNLKNCKSLSWIPSIFSLFLFSWSVMFLFLKFCCVKPFHCKYSYMESDYEDYKNGMHSSSLNLWQHLPMVALPILKIGNYQQNSNELIKNQSEKKRCTFRYKK